jgi:serine/threonine protein kinase
MARYKILGVLDEGRQSLVYQARDLNFPDRRKLVAVKEWLLSAVDSERRITILRMAQREANILAMLSHPAIPSIYDFFELNDRVYMVMEYNDGHTLERLLAETQALPPGRVIAWAVDLCEALAYLHEQAPQPILHINLEPANVMIDKLGKAWLIGFGRARHYVPDQHVGSMMNGGHAAPEQFAGQVSPASDQFSLAAVLHHVLTRTDPRLEPPLSFDQRPVVDLNDHVSQELAQIIERALAFEPQDRFPACRDMQQALAALP